MIELKTTPINRRYYINNDVIYKIVNTKLGDGGAITDEVKDPTTGEITSYINSTEKLPRILVTRGEGTDARTTVYYLDSLIEIGDVWNLNDEQYINVTYTDSKGDEVSVKMPKVGSFKKLGDENRFHLEYISGYNPSEGETNTIEEWSEDKKINANIGKIYKKTLAQGSTEETKYYKLLYGNDVDIYDMFINMCTEEIRTYIESHPSLTEQDFIENKYGSVVPSWMLSTDAISDFVGNLNPQLGEKNKNNIQFNVSNGLTELKIQNIKKELEEYEKKLEKKYNINVNLCELFNCNNQEA